MTNATESIDLRIKTFKASSSFTPGDPFSFKIRISEEVTLPGRYDPETYIHNLGVDLTGKNVLVACAGNGGLCVAALNAGASTVVALEPRVVYQKSLVSVASFTAEVLGTTFSQRALGEKLVESFDIVLWSEGVDEIVHPKNLFESVLGSMATGGLLCLELAHGHHAALPESINSWRPSKGAFSETLTSYPGLEVVGELTGRDQVRTIYKIQNNAVRTEELDGPETVEDIQDLADDLKVVIKEPESPVDTVAEVVPSEDQPPAPVRAVAEKIKQLMPVEDKTAGDLDSIYEGRASTPKSKGKKKTRTRKKKAQTRRGKSKD